MIIRITGAEMKNKKTSILCIAILSLSVCACESTEPDYPIPDSVADMEGVWKFDASITHNTDSITYILNIESATLVVGKTTSKGWPYYLPATLSGTNLICKIGSHRMVWEVPLEGLPVDAGRAIVIAGFGFKISTPFGIFDFDCAAGWRTDDKTGPDELSGRVYIDNLSTLIENDGRGYFTASKIQ